MKAQQRHDLHTNWLADWLEAKIEQIKPYSQLIVGVVVAVIVLFGVYMYLRSMERQASQAASEQLIVALSGFDTTKNLEATVDNHPDTAPAVVAELLLGNELLQRGANNLYVNKPEATDNLGRAADRFLRVSTSTTDPLLRSWALYGLARAREAQGNLEGAEESYRQLLAAYPDNPLATQAKQRLDSLESKSTKEFYAWFAKQDPRPTAIESEPGSPGAKPAFDLSDPASPLHDFKLPAGLEGALSPEGGPGLSGPEMPLAPADSTVPAAAPSEGTTPMPESPAAETPAADAPVSDAPATDTPMSESVPSSPTDSGEAPASEPESSNAESSGAESTAPASPEGTPEAKN